MKNLLFLISVLTLTSNIFAQRLVSYEKIDSFTVDQLNEVIDDFGAGGLLNPQYAVDVYRVLYRTEYNDSLTTVSGALVVPRNPDCPAPLVSYLHGTTSDKFGVPSYGSTELNICLIFAAEGKVMLAPDYIGLGSSTINISPYIHGFSHAHSTVNLMRAAREINDTEFDLNLSNQIFIFGYSQGGYAAAVAVKYIEELYSDEFKVTAAAPMSGPYNLAGAQTDFINSGNDYATPGYLPYLIFGYQSVYGDLYDSIPQYFRSPYDTLLFPLFDGHQVGLGTINDICTPNPVDMFTDEAEIAFNTDPNFPLRVRLEENDLLSWTPQTPMKMFYCTGDEQVFYRNAQIADSVWNLNGAPNISSENLDDLAFAFSGTNDHGGCVAPALINGRSFFAEYENFGIEIILNYNAENNEFELSVLNDDVSNYTIEWNNGTGESTLGNVQAGIPYFVNVTNNVTGCTNRKNFSKETVLSVNGIEVTPLIDVYPNPTKNLINLTVSQLKNYDVFIVNSMGQTVFQKTNVRISSLGINIEDLSSGIYNVIIYGNDSRYATAFVKQ